MSLVQIRYFLEVARSGSVRVASERLNIAASALSRQIQNIEHELGVQLFDRKARGMELTPAGEIYARYARSMSLETDRVRSEIEELKGIKRGLIRVHSVEGVIADVMTNAIAQFQAVHPGVRFRLTACGTDDVITAVREGVTDIGVSFNAQPDADVHFVRRIPDPLVAIVHPGHILGSRSEISFLSILAHAVAIPESGFGIRRLLDDVCRVKGISLTPALETNSIEALRGFARSGAGVAILPSTSSRFELKHGGVLLIPFADAPLRLATMDLSILAGRKLPLAVNAFMSVLERCLVTPQKPGPPP
jgi:DNA-binding transcriptional LysR family regulator